MALNGFYSGWLAMVDWFFRWALVSFLESACIRSDPKGKSTPKKRSHTDSRRPTSRYDSLSLSLVLSVRLSVSLSIHLSPSLAAPCLPSLCTGFLLARRGVPAGGRCSRTRWTHFRFHLPSRPVFTRFFFLSLSLSLSSSSSSWSWSSWSWSSIDSLSTVSPFSSRPTFSFRFRVVAATFRSRCPADPV